jgi:Tfp pilus assembly protein PilV
MRSHASALAADIADRMRANRAAVAEYVLPLTTTSVTVAADSPISTIDLSQWRAALAATLPQGTGAIAVVPAASGPGGVATITIQWGERDDVNPVQFVTETEI